MNSFSSYLQSFSNISPEALNALLNLFSEKSFNKKDRFTEAGKTASQLAFVQEGILRSYYTSSEGVEYNKVFFTTPSIVGAYSSLITSQPSRIDIECLTDCKLLVAPYTEIVKLYDKYAEIERLNRVIAEDFFVRNESKEIELVTTDATARYRIFQEEYPGLENNIAQYHIASYLGITPTQLSRIRAQKK